MQLLIDNQEQAEIIIIKKMFEGWGDVEMT